MERDFWSIAMQVAIWGVLMSAVMGWLARNRLKTRPGRAAGDMRHPVSTLILGLVVFVFFAGIAVVSNVWNNGTANLWTTLLFSGFAAMALAMVADYVFARHSVSDQGMDYGRITGRRGSFRWHEVTGVRYSPVWKWFRIELQSGDVVRVSAMHTGLPEFAVQLLNHVRRDLPDEPTCRMLEATAQGQPPEVW